jgi:hypothetical protein
MCRPFRFGPLQAVKIASIGMDGSFVVTCIELPSYLTVIPAFAGMTVGKK